MCAYYVRKIELVALAVGRQIAIMTDRTLEYYLVSVSAFAPPQSTIHHGGLFFVSIHLVCLGLRPHPALDVTLLFFKTNTTKEQHANLTPTCAPKVNIIMIRSTWVIGSPIFTWRSEGSTRTSGSSNCTDASRQIFIKRVARWDPTSQASGRQRSKCDKSRPEEVTQVVCCWSDRETPTNTNVSRSSYVRGSIQIF